jgi:hypothetical protein
MHTPKLSFGKYEGVAMSDAPAWALAYGIAKTQPDSDERKAIYTELNKRNNPPRSNSKFGRRKRRQRLARRSEQTINPDGFDQPPAQFSQER